MSQVLVRRYTQILALHKHLQEITRQAFANTVPVLAKIREVFNEREPDQFLDLVITLHIRTLDEICQPKHSNLLGRALASLA